MSDTTHTMRDTTQSFLTIVSVVFAAVASLAASVQSYFSWSDRNVPMVSVAFAQVVTKCAEALSAAHEYGAVASGLIRATRR
jgi:hypothetical protein